MSLENLVTQKKKLKKIKVIKVRNIQRKKIQNNNKTIKLKKVLKNVSFFFFLKLRLPKLSLQVLQAPTYTWQEGGNTTPQQAKTT